MRYGNLAQLERMFELHVAALLVGPLPAIGLEQLDDLIAGHGWITHTNTHTKMPPGCDT